MNDLFSEIPLSEQIAEVEREISMRRRVYARLVVSGNMTQESVSRRIAVMQAAHDSLVQFGRLRRGERVGAAEG